MNVVLATRRFWPLAGEPQTLYAQLTTELLLRGVRPTLVTAQLDRDWPLRVVHREAPLYRLPHPGRGMWGRARYLRNLARWLRQKRDEIDLVCVEGMRYDAFTAIGALCKTSIPVVLRSSGVAGRGDCRWQTTVRRSRVARRCRSADAIIVTNGTTESELLGAGYSQHRLHLISDGVALPPPRSASTRVAARRDLADTHQVLAIAEHAPLVVYAGPLHKDKGLLDLLAAWPPIAARWPNARLWLVGHGPQLDDLWEAIKHRDLAHQVILTGSFDHLEQVLHAADVFVLPSLVEGLSHSLLEAMAAGLPVAASDVAGNRELIEDRRHGLLFPPSDPAALTAAMVRLLDQPQQAATLAAAARRHVEEHYSIARMADDYQHLFQSLIADKQRAAG